MEKRKRTLKRTIVLFWKGLTGIIAATAEWFTVILGMKDESKYGKFIRRVVGGCFAFIMFVFACAGGNALYEFVYKKVNAAKYLDESYYDSQYLSRNATYYSRAYETDGYVETRDGKKTVKGIHWISKPLGDDSLVCYSNGDARGYFNMLTGEIAIKPQYKHAWVFSDGLASVDDNGMIKFIDSKGNVVIDLNIPYITGAEGYVFHNGHCVIHNNKRDKFGLIDKKGNWMLKAEYDAILPKDSFFVVSKGGMQSVLTENLKPILPFMEADLWISGNSITATMKDHTLRKYNLQGELIDDFLISNVDRLLYDTDEIRYTTAKNYDDEKKRIALGLKQLNAHPWDALSAELKVGDKVKGKVVVMADYGAFVEIAPGVEGLIHVSEMSWSQHLRSAQDFVKIGDKVEVIKFRN
jgi:hypothetical protein